MRRHDLKTADELRAAIKASLAESKANPNPGYHSWEECPAWWMRYHNWQAGDGRRRNERRSMRRWLRLAKEK